MDHEYIVIREVSGYTRLAPNWELRPFSSQQKILAPHFFFTWFCMPFFFDSAVAQKMDGEDSATQRLLFFLAPTPSLAIQQSTPSRPCVRRAKRCTSRPPSHIPLRMALHTHPPALAGSSFQFFLCLCPSFDPFSPPSPSIRPISADSGSSRNVTPTCLKGFRAPSRLQVSHPSFPVGGNGRDGGRGGLRSHFGFGGRIFQNHHPPPFSSSMSAPPSRRSSRLAQSDSGDHANASSPISHPPSSQMRPRRGPAPQNGKGKEAVEDRFGPSLDPDVVHGFATTLPVTR